MSATIFLKKTKTTETTFWFMKTPCTATAENVTNKSTSMPGIPRDGKVRHPPPAPSAMKKPDLRANTHPQN
jgi:hypothetical protein